MKLVIVESPTKARTLSRFLGSGYEALASMGHLRDLPKKKLGVDIKNNFRPTYVLVPGKKETIEKLKKTAKKAEKVILATDPDREGEAIAYHISKILDQKKDKIERIVFHEITRRAIEQALAAPGRINSQLVASQQARRILDRLVGYKLSPLLWRKIRRGLSAGRVQSPAVRLIVEREREIKDFKSEEYWIISVDLKSRKKDIFSAKLIKREDKKIEIKTKNQADKVVADLKKADYQVEKIKKEEAKRFPPPPFITSTLQRAGANVFHWSAKKTMREAQQLYEKGLITYHRTDSVNLASEAIKAVRKYIAKKYPSEYLPEKARLYKTKSKLAQEAHEAIRPTKLEIKELKMTIDGQKLFRLISNRFIASQMTPQILEKDTVEIKAGEYLLQASGEIEKFAGYKILYRGRNKKEDFLPELEEGEPLQLIKVKPEQKFTQPPARYNEASLIRALEQRGIGRPSTYAPIISTIQARQYVEKIEGHFEPTPVGETVNDFLLKYFSKIVDYNFTAEMEDDLDRIAQGGKKWEPVVAEFYRPFAKKLTQVEKNAKREEIKAEPIGKKCPQCRKGEQVIRVGRYGKFLSCSRFPECKWKAVFIEKVKGFKCPECKADVLIRKTRTGKRFYGCANYPKCQWASWRKPSSSEQKAENAS